MASMVITFIVIALIGVAIGMLSGMLGVGGGAVSVPVFRLVFGMEPIVSTATSLFTIIPTSVSGAITHIRNKTCVPKLGLAMGVGGACTSPVGVWLASMSPGWAVIGASALVIAYSAFTMLRKAIRMGASTSRASAPAKHKAQVEGAEGDGSVEAAVPIPDFSRSNFAKGFCIGLVTGVASGYVGLGGGFIMVPLMMSLLDFPMKLSSGTSLIAVMLLAVPGTIAQGFLGNIDLLAGIALSCGSIPGALAGAKLITRIPERALRFSFAAFLGVGAILLIAKELGALA